MSSHPLRNRSRLLGTLTAALVLASGVATWATASPADDQPVADATEQTEASTEAQDPRTGDAGDAEVASEPALTMAAPASARAGEPFTVTVSAADVAGAAAYEGVLRFDDRSLSLADATAPVGARVLTTPRAGSGSAFAVLPCAEPGCTASAPDLTLTFIARQDGSAVIDLLATMVVDAAGASLDHATSRSAAVAVGDAGVRRSSAAPAWSMGRTTEATPRADVTGDGKVTLVDISEAAIAWHEGRVDGDPCDLDPTTALADVNGDGCADVADLQSLIGAPGTAAVEQETPAYRGFGGGSGFAAGAGRGASLRSVHRPAPAQAPAAPPDLTHVVDTTNDTADTNLADGVCISSGGGCSLRAAIQQANATAGPNRIHFAIPGTAVHTIQLASRLPTINDTTGPVTIDGYTQPGSAPNTAATTSNAVLKVQVRGQSSDSKGTAFTITSPDNVIRGLAIHDSYYGVRIFDTLAAGNRIVGNFIGTDATGTFGAGPNFSLAAGVWLTDGPTRNRIGTPALADRNVISGNRTVGVKVEQARTTDNYVQNNIIGLTPSGTSARPNNAGLDLQWHSQRTIVGGTGANERNVISGNAYTGIDLSHTTRSNVVAGNFIGTWPDGLSANSTSGNPDGVLIKDNPYGNDIRSNVISGNDRTAIWHKHNYTDRNFVRDNLIGVGLDGRALPNRDWGIWLTGESDIIEGNVIAHNEDGGIYVHNSNGGESSYPAELTRQNRISGNSFYANGGLAVDITPVGVNANDAGDIDTGVHDKLNFPETTKVTTGRVEGTACPGCVVELYVADAATGTHGEGRQRFASVTTDSAGVFAIDHPAIAGSTVLTMLAIDPANNTSEFSKRFSVSGDKAPANVAPQISPVASRQDPTGTPVELAVAATDGNGDLLTYFAVGLPAGLTIDSATGRITGTPASAGAHDVTLNVSDGRATASTTFAWTIVASTSAPVITDPGPQTVPQGTPLELALTAVDPDGDAVTFSASGLPVGLAIDPLTGVVSGTPTTIGDSASSVTASDGTRSSTLKLYWRVHAAPFACAVDGPTKTLSWTDQQAGTYYVHHLLNGTQTYIGETTSLSRQVTNLDGTYTVTHWVGGKQVASCDGPGNPPKPAFTCTVDGPTKTLSWTDEGASKYYIRHLLNGTDTYLGETTGLSRPITNLDGTYTVIHWLGGTQTSTSCNGPGNPPKPPYACTVDAATMTLSWTDEGASAYYVRHLLNGTETYLGETKGLSRPISTAEGTYTVRYWRNGTAVDTSCTAT